ncbi:hypothetical protein H5V45_13530 [Nocardioides sp. KIGAM211]|uniref:Uncharacterized protein n=1 Tax=Nocardioides luti TaxID=2761101 RepID=A0A7X0RHF7_9ACTN|nr:hypothetical protein [Nocardioides luti]MBB6628342.1 hypothetical protein [Nocardioides luti]
MTFALDHDHLARTARVLLRHDLALRAEATPEAPDTGGSSATTAVGLEALAGRVRRVGDDAHALADALDGFLAEAARADGRVGLALDLLGAGALR